ncbi:alpha carbonic anhydrase 7-like [Bidens hawaiensis]|uniref:alpha carbonic anhydrase 7-like n=1 Tax=Bidens hawaiensis TaxID=980011 RepID=UPI00404A429E
MPKNKGGLGISRIKDVNNALLSNWGWRYKTEESGLWKRVVDSIHNHPKDWEVVPVKKGDPEFSYEDMSSDGPKKWGSLTSKWASCSSGKSQSPIDIDSKNAKEQPNDLKKDYKEAAATLFNKGHNILVQWQGDAGGIEVNGSTYKLVQCHWHTPSEHTLDGKSNEMKQLAVIGVLYEVGAADPFIEQMTASKFKGLDSKGSDLGNVSAADATSSKKYFRYGGSLTTPPCSEVVTWTVAEDVKTISEDQIELLKGAVDHEFEKNARPVQGLNGRAVTQFEDEYVLILFINYMKLVNVFTWLGFE